MMAQVTQFCLGDHRIRLVPMPHAWTWSMLWRSISANRYGCSGAVALCRQTTLQPPVAHSLQVVDEQSVIAALFDALASRRR